MTVVLDPAAKDYLVEPDPENTFEYLSMAIHGFISCIQPDLIAGWIVPEQHYDMVVRMMDTGEIDKRQLWKDTDFPCVTFDEDKPQQYGIYPDDIAFYYKDLKKFTYYEASRVRHLQAILAAFSDIDWSQGGLALEKCIEAWHLKNEERIMWDEDELIYKEKCPAR